MATRLAHEYFRANANKISLNINNGQRNLVEQFIAYRERNEKRLATLDTWQKYVADCEEMITSLVNVLDAEYAIKRTCKPFAKVETQKGRKNFWDGPQKPVQHGNPLRFYSNLTI